MLPKVTEPVSEEEYQEDLQEAIEDQTEDERETDRGSETYVGARNLQLYMWALMALNDFTVTCIQGDSRR